MRARLTPSSIESEADQPDCTSFARIGEHRPGLLKLLLVER